MNGYKTIVGMEIHVELKTRSKMFCGCKNDPFHAPKPNIYTCPVCLGLPGALPVPNKKAVEWTIKLGLALGAKISEFSKFDRKNYFYPDLPKGYQISQYDKPLCLGGIVKTELGDVRIHRVHLEEDTGKLLHQTINGKKVTLVDFNRSGVPLVEIVTEPDIHSSEQAKAFLKKLHQIIRYLDISDADMEKGSMRLEPNISVAPVISNEVRDPVGDFSATPRNDNFKLPNYKVEVKNINSFNFVKKAIDYEVARHIELLEAGETPIQETRGWDEKKSITVPQRRKEEAHDYRYFPEPDIPPMRFTKDFIENIRKEIPELSDAKSGQFIKKYHLTPQYASLATVSLGTATNFEQLVKEVNRINPNIDALGTANWVFNKKINLETINPSSLAQEIVDAKTVKQVNEGELGSIIEQILIVNPKQVEDYKKGKTGIIMFFVGQVMRELKGQGDATAIRNLLEKALQ